LSDEGDGCLAWLAKVGCLLILGLGALFVLVKIVKVFWEA
jgi:hypothetical protein